MKPTAIVYTSNTGHTERYAKLLGTETGLPVYSLEEAKKSLAARTPVIYLGWLFASSVKGYARAAKRYVVCAVCGVGLCPTGGLLAEVRKAIRLPDEIPLFTVQGGMDYAKLRGINKMMIDFLTRSLAKKQSRTEGEDAMLALLKCSDDFVRAENLGAMLSWYRS